MCIEVFIRWSTGTSGCVIVSKLDEQACKSEFEFHCVPHSFRLVPHLSKELSKLLYQRETFGRLG